MNRIGRTMMTSARMALIAASLAVAASAQQLPEGDGKALVERSCKQCHELARSISLRQDRDGWNQTMTKMTAFGMKTTEKDYNQILDYLSKHYPADELPPVNINTAPAIELEARLSLRRSQAAQVIAYRRKNGKFKSIDDLKKVPLIDMAKLEDHKDMIVF